MADSRKHRNKFYLTSGILVALLLIALVLLNLTSDTTSRFKIDLTRDKIYSISEATVEILDGVTEKVDVTYYCSDELPSFLANIVRDTRDVFEEFRRVSGGKFRYEIVNPEDLLNEYAEDKTSKYMELYEKLEAPDLSEEKKTELSKKLDKLEPKPAQRWAMFMGGAQKPEERRSERKARASARASEAKKDAGTFFRDILFEEFTDERERELAQEGVQAIPVEDRQANSVKQLRIFSAIKIAYLDQEPEVIPLHASLESLEYDLAYRILKVSLQQKPVIAFFDARKPNTPPPMPGQPPQGPMSEYRQILGFVRGIAEVREFSLKEGDALDDLVESIARQRERERKEKAGQKLDASSDEKFDIEEEQYSKYISALVIAQPDNLEDRQVFEINRAVSLGIPTIFLVSPYTTDVSTQGQQQGGYPISLLRTGLGELFREWGWELGTEMLASNESGRIGYAQPVRFGQRQLMTRSAIPATFAVSPRAATISSSSGLTNRIPALVFPSTAGIGLLEETLAANGIDVTELVHTGEQTWSKRIDPVVQPDNPFMRNQPSGPNLIHYQDDLISRKRPERFNDFLESPKLLAAHFQGRFPFTYDGKAIPEWKPPPEPDENANPHANIPGLPGGLPPGFPGGGGARDRDAIPDPQDPGAGASTEPAPSETSQPSDGEGAKAPEKKAPTAKLSPRDGRVIVLASADMVKDQFVALIQDFPPYRFNADFFSNCLETFSLGDILMKIRRKSLSVPQFNEGSEDETWWINLVNYGIVPLLVAVLGILRVVARSRASVAYERRQIEAQRAFAMAGAPAAAAVAVPSSAPASERPPESYAPPPPPSAGDSSDATGDASGDSASGSSDESKDSQGADGR